jgi:hypothetical protein
MDEVWTDACEEAENALAAYDAPLPVLPDTCPFPVDLFVEKGFDTAAAIEHLKQAVADLSPQHEG